MNLEDHPTVREYRSGERVAPPGSIRETLDSQWFKQAAMEAGADDVGLASPDQPALAGELINIKRTFPETITLASIVCRLNPENIRCVSRSVSDLEFLQGFERVNEACRKIAVGLRERGARAVNPASGFPMDLENWPGRMWPVSHKPVAIAAGMGQLGLSRLLLHPRYGAFVALGTMLIDREFSDYDTPIEYNPCVDCKLCAAVCPVGAIGADGHFNFANCMTHNYRDRMGGFSDWVENMVDARNRFAYRRKVTDPETVSMWQSLSYGICNKSSYCMAVCPAGSEYIGPYLEDRKAYTRSVVQPLQEKNENIYVVPGGDAEKHVAKRFPHKNIRRVGNGLRPKSARSFLDALPLVFQPGRSEGLNATYYFQFTGADPVSAAVTIQGKSLTVTRELTGKADLTVKADGAAWVGFLRGEKKLLWALITGKIRLKGSPRLMKAFARCFPS